jgi:hypothetical protein
MGSVPSHPAAPLVGRGRELEAIESALDSVRARSRAPFLAFAGRLGLGKTRLLGELDRRAESRGYLVLAGRGSEWEAGVPYGVVADALDGYLGSLPAAELAQ